MKRETKNEIDLLLRRLSRRDGISARDRETQIGIVPGQPLEVGGDGFEPRLVHAARGDGVAGIADGPADLPLSGDRVRLP